MPYAGGIATLFGFTPLPGRLAALALLIVVTYLVATELVKWRLFSRTAG